MKQQRFKKTQTIDNLLKIHAFMQEYRKEHGINPTDAEIVEQGLASSTSVAASCSNRMEELGMVQRIRKVARGTSPLPISQAKEEVRMMYQKLQDQKLQESI